MTKYWNLKKILSGITAVCIAFVTILALDVCHAPLSVCSAEDSVNNDYQSEIEELVALVNEVRKDAGLNPLYIVPVLNDASYIRSKETVEKYDHTRPDGTNFYTVLDNCGFSSLLQLRIWQRVFPPLKILITSGSILPDIFAIFLILSILISVQASITRMVQCTDGTGKSFLSLQMKN